MKPWISCSGRNKPAQEFSSFDIQTSKANSINSLTDSFLNTMEPANNPNQSSFIISISFILPTTNSSLVLQISLVTSKLASLAVELQMASQRIMHGFINAVYHGPQTHYGSMARLKAVYSDPSITHHDKLINTKRIYNNCKFGTLLDSDVSCSEWEILVWLPID